MNGDPQLMDIVHWHQIPVGAYNLRLNGSPGICVPEKNYSWYSEGTSEVVDMFLDIKPMFPGHLGTVQVDLGYLDGSEDFEPLECKHLEVTMSDFDIQVGLEDVLQLFKPSESLKVSLPNWQMDLERFKDLEKVEIGYAEWMTGTDLLKLDSRRIHISGNLMDSEDVNGFLKQWFHAQKPRNLEIFTILNFKDFKLEDLLEGLPTSSFDPTIRSRRYFTPDANTFYNNDSKPILAPNDFREGIDMAKAVDIRRSDGLMASVLLKEHQLVVVVWKEPFPGNVVLEILENEVKKEMFKITRNIGWMRNNGIDMNLAKENVKAHEKVAKLKNKMKIVREL